MRAWTIAELDNVVNASQPLIGLRLQEIQVSEQDLVLGFYSPGGLLWLWIDLNAVRPAMLPWAELPMHLPKRKSPLVLFLRAHFVDRVLRATRRRESEGRVVELIFGKPEDELRLEVRLIPHLRNVTARAGEKRVSWQKPKELAESTAPPSPDKQPLRGLDELREQWSALRLGKGPGKTGKQVVSSREAELAKKKRARDKVLEDLKRKRELPYREVGDWLKARQTLEVPRAWDPYVDKRRKLAWNIEECFAKARDIEGKIYGTEQRLELLEREIARLEQQKDASPGAAPPKPKPQPLQDAGADGRTLRLNEEITVVRGRSAADNLNLLRRARAWDYWFPLRDFPTGHAILFRNKGTAVSEKTVHQVVEWYVRQALGAKYKNHLGEKLQILIAECRFVRPIKGDKLGRVTYRDERVFTYQIPS